MKIKTQDLIGPPLAWAVGRCEGREIDFHVPEGRSGLLNSMSALAGDTVFYLMEREGISVALYGASPDLWGAAKGLFCGSGPTIRTAVLRCFVASKLGDEVEVPDELVKSPT